MTETLRPDTPEQLAEAVRLAVGEKEPMEVVAGGTKARYGRPVDIAKRLSLGSFSGISLYEPEELVMTAGAATPISTIEKALAKKNQQLAFEPGNLGPLLGVSGKRFGHNGATIGGIVACNLAGPRRIRFGAARDNLLGFQAVSGRGELFKSGGRVIKNVTGFDLSKLIAGSFGTLAVMTEVSVRVLPAPEDTRTVLVLGCEDDAGVRALTEALGTPYEVSGGAHLPGNVAVLSKTSPVAVAGGAVTAIRIEGPAPSVDFRCGAIRALLEPFGQVEQLNKSHSLSLWREIGDVGFFAGDAERQIWKLSVPPAAGPSVARDILAGTDGQCFFDWGGGLLWVSLPPAPDAGHDMVRAAIVKSGGHATLVRAEPEARARVPVFQPQPAPLAALTRRVKEGFDPARVLNPGRMYEGV
jgi:glycolate oxidase FAD binding subunit